MRCYHVLVHGHLRWLVSDLDEDTRPAGFFAHRHVLARGAEQAAEVAIKRVRESFKDQVNWIRAGEAELELDAGEVSPAPTYKLLSPDNRGCSFYTEG